MNVFIIPGNPPARHFYQLWADEIQKKHSKCAIYISSYGSGSKKKDSFAYLHDVAFDHGQKLLAFHQAVQNKVMVIGHSLGAWMALNMLEKREAIIEKCFLLYPFLRRPSIQGRAILRIIHSLYQIPFSENLLAKGRRILERFFTDLEHVTDEELRISLTLSYHEHKVIARHRGSLEIPEHLRKKLHMIYCDQDRWCPEGTIQEMKQWISTEKVGAPHGFITSAKEREIVLKALL